MRFPASTVMFCFIAGIGLKSSASNGAELVQTIEQIKPSLVGIGTLLRTRSPAINFAATGFAVADGQHVLTNAHAVEKLLDLEAKEVRIVLVPHNGQPEARPAEVVALDRDHDLALLKIEGPALRPLRIGDSARVREGQTLAFTGFPIGMVLGFHPATHRGMVSAITPVALPGITAKQLNSQAISRIRNAAYSVFQLDGTAYPGNSGSPLYDPEDGTVYGVINSVFIQGTRENAIAQPSGITYAIPESYIRDLLLTVKANGVDLH